MRGLLTLLMCLLLALTNLQAQYVLKIIAPPEINFTATQSFTSPELRQKELSRILQQFYENAYLAANIDSIKELDKTLSAYISPGKPYKWAILKKGNVDEGALSSIGFREKLFKGKPLYYTEVLRLQEKLITHYENNGYPFASIQLDSIQISNEGVSAVLQIKRNELIKIDSLIVKGNANISPIYLYNYINLKPGKPYNELLIQNAPIRLKELAFIKISKPPIVQFNDTHTKLVLFIDKRKASRFDGIIGILPNENNTKILFTGDVKLKLHNAIGRGELIDFNWRSLAKGTQDLKTHITYPFLFSTPFGIDYTIKLYKKDTSFIDVNQNIGIQYLLKGNNYFKAFYKGRQSSLLSTKGLEAITVLPPYADIKTNAYGLELSLEKLDYRFNPRKGFSLLINASAGNRTILKNSKLNPIVYTNIDLKSTQYEAEFQGSFFIPLFQKSTIMLRVQSSWINSATIFQNELFRIGGIKTLRGFDEESIFASVYGIGTIEYRYLLEENSYLYFFTDAAYYENQAIAFSGDRFDTPFGFGTGLSFETKAGIFSINYALGKQFNNPIYLRAGKVHFGIVNYF